MIDVLSDEAREEVRRLIRAHTARNTVSAKAAQAALVRRGVVTAQGELTPEYGGAGRKEESSDAS